VKRTNQPAVFAELNHKPAVINLLLRICVVEVLLRAVYELAPIIGDVIAAHCPGTSARAEFVRACLHGHWDEARSMVEGMLAEPSLLRGYQETRLREFIELLPTERADSRIDLLRAATG
jgi:hypothetical protein